MLKKFPSISDLPVSLPESVRDQLAQAVGPQVVSDCSWITLSLIHVSYLNEHQQEFEKAGISTETLRRTLGLMKSFGVHLATLALYHLAYENPEVRTPSEAGRFAGAPMRNVTARIAENLGLMNAAFVSLGISRDLDNKRFRQRFLSLLGYQLLGAVGICGGYRTLFSLIETNVKTSHKTSIPIASYKTVLQEYTQGRRLGGPEYKVVGTTGPDHDQLFQVQVHTRDGKWAEGEGRVKKRAEGDAARQYMERFASDHLAKKTQKATMVDAQVRPPHVTPELHRRGVEDLCELFEIPQDKMWLLSQALVHSSFLNETPLKNIQDNTFLAQLGSQVLAAIALELVFSKFLEQPSSRDKEFPSGSIVATFCDTSNVSKWFDLLKLEKLLLLSSGESQSGLPDTVKANAFQAVLASLFLARGAREDAETFLPDKLLHWFTDSMDTLVAEPDETIDPKEKLQRQLQAIGMTWEYQATYQGANHAQEWEASITLSSRTTKRRFVLRGGEAGATRRQAEKHIASLVSSTIDDVNSGVGVLPIDTLLSLFFAPYK